MLPPAVVLAIIAPLMTLSDPIAVRFFWRRWDAGLLRSIAIVGAVRLLLREA